MKGDDDLLVVRSSTLYLKSEFFMQGQRLICFSRIIIGGSNFDWSNFIVCMYNSHFVFFLEDQICVLWLVLNMTNLFLVEVIQFSNQWSRCDILIVKDMYDMKCERSVQMLNCMVQQLCFAGRKAICSGDYPKL